MAKRSINTLKLGTFVIAGLGFLVMLLYVIGKNQNVFGNTFMLKARFENVHGLMPGNSIRFGGIDAGSVKKIEVLNDTTIEVTLLVKSKMKNYIHKNATVNIITDGLIGNKLINIQPVKAIAPVVEEGDILYSTKALDTEEMLAVLNTTNNDIAVIAKELKQIVTRINESKVIWGILEDESLPASIRQSLYRVKTASASMATMMIHLNSIVDDVRNGKGSIGELLKDTVMADDVREAIQKIRGIGSSADTLTARISMLIESVNNEINNGDGTVNALLKDKQLTQRLNNSLQNIEQGTQAFNENMEALKHNFLFRGYFKKLENQRKKEASAPRY